MSEVIKSGDLGNPLVKEDYSKTISTSELIPNKREVTKDDIEKVVKKKKKEQGIEDEQIIEEVDYNIFKIKELKQMLNEKGIEYNKLASKEELILLLEETNK